MARGTTERNTMNGYGLWRSVPAIALVLAVAACSDDGTGIGGDAYTIAVQGGNEQAGLPGETVAAPLEVLVSQRDGGEPAEGVVVHWEVVAGGGASLSSATSSTDSLGVATARLSLGPDTGTYRVQASINGSTGAPAVFEAYAVLPPHIAAVSPAEAAAGSTVIVAGENFPADPDRLAVAFDGIRGTVLAATATSIEVRVPSCIPTRTVGVTVQVGAVTSVPAALRVTGDGAPPLELAVGQAVAISEPDALSCIRLPGGDIRAMFLVVPHNAIDLSGSALPLQLIGLAGESPPLTAVADAAGPAPRSLGARRGALAAGQARRAWRSGSAPPALVWEMRIRRREREIDPAELIRPSRNGAPAGEGDRLLRSAVAAPAVGDQRTFNVYNEDEEFSTVTARVEYVSDHAVIYQDVDAPDGGLTATDFTRFGALFDDPIYDTVISVYGATSDVDGNGRITILFTPVVNGLTPEGSAGFVAGFFFGLDLTDGENSNQAEIFYSLVPDPTGEFGDPRSTEDVLATIEPVLAHELQHMVHFNQRVLIRQVGQEALWLSEGLAHMAEDVVGDVFDARGDEERAFLFRAPNFERAFRFLADPGAASLIGDEPPGTLEERGAQWLFLKYMAGHYGGEELLRSLTQTTSPGVANIEAATGAGWNALVNNWAAALWADDAPELEGITVDSLLTFTNIDLRATVGSGSNGYPLFPLRKTFEDFAFATTLPAASPAYLILEAGTLAPDPLHLSLAGPRGAAFPLESRPGLSLLRIR